MGEFLISDSTRRANSFINSGCGSRMNGLTNLKIAGMLLKEGLFTPSASAFSPSAIVFGDSWLRRDWTNVSHASGKDSWR